MKWDPSKYAEFADYRSRPFFDLTGRIAAEEPRRVVDLGCGPGSLTAALADRWPRARVTGLDSSAAMIAAANAASQLQNLDFEVGDIAAWAPPQDLDVLVSNAALQWLPGHQDLLREWASCLTSGAWLAFQVPGNFSAPSHVLMRRQAASSKWHSLLDGVLRHEDAVSEPADYLALLLEAGFDADAWETTYLHVLQGPDPVLEWVRGTGLRPVLAALAPEEAAEFETEYAEGLRHAYPAGPHGTVFPFRRIFCVARKR